MDKYIIFITTSHEEGGGIIRFSLGIIWAFIGFIFVNDYKNDIF